MEGDRERVGSDGFLEVKDFDVGGTGNSLTINKLICVHCYCFGHYGNICLVLRQSDRPKHFSYLNQLVL